MAEITYFLPKALSHALMHESAAGLKSTEVVADIDGFYMPGHFVSGGEDTFAKLIKESPVRGPFQIIELFEGTSGLAERGKVRINGKEYPVLSLAEQVAADLLDCGSKLHEFMDLDTDVHDTLKRLSRWSGRSVSVASPVTSCMRPTEWVSNNITIIVDASPPGEATTLCHSELCGCTLTGGSETVSHAGPARGYGSVIKDETGNVVAQIVDGAMYLFVPLQSSCKRMLMENRGPGIFKRVLRLAWNAQHEERESFTETVLNSAEEYCSLLDTYSEEPLDEMRIMLRDIDEQLASLEAQQRSLLASKRVELARMRGHTAIYESIDRAVWERDWEILSHLPSVHRVVVVDCGVHVETEDLVAIYEGVKYRLGSFIIRYHNNQIFVWPLVPAHPRGRGHPHISEVGHPCFGNMGIAIRTAASEMRIADAVAYMLRWLIEGYDPELADTTIKEWPIVEKP